MCMTDWTALTGKDSNNSLKDNLLNDSNKEIEVEAE